MHALLTCQIIILLYLFLTPSHAILRPSSAFLPSLSKHHPNPTITTTNNAPLATGDPPTSLKCFEPDTPKVHPVDSSHCSIAIEVILHDPKGVMTPQKFGRKTDPSPPSIYEIPSAWRVENCLILLTAADDTAVDEFRLVDVIERAQLILRKCVKYSKTSLGGVATLGLKTFFVAVDGPPDFNEGGSGGNGTIVRWVTDRTNSSAVDVDSTLASKVFFA